MNHRFLMGLIVSVVVAAGSIGVEMAIGSRGGWGDFLLFSILPEFVQRFHRGALYVAKPLLAALMFTSLYLGLRWTREPQPVISASVTSAAMIAMCLGDAVV